MAIRFPLQGVKTQNLVNEVGAGSVAGGIAIPFMLPQDTGNVVVKMTASISGGGASAILQTTDDGGTTWYDVARTSVVSNANNALAQWLSAPVDGAGVRTANTFGGASILSTGIGNSAASTLSQGQVSGLPILSTQGRVFVVLTAAVSATSLLQVNVMTNSQGSNVS